MQRASSFYQDQAKELEMTSFGSVKPTAVTDIAKGDHAIVALGVCCISMLEVIDVTIWPIIWISSLFFASLTFDIAADETVSQPF